MGAAGNPANGRRVARSWPRIVSTRGGDMPTRPVGAAERVAAGADLYPRRTRTGGRLALDRAGLPHASEDVEIVRRDDHAVVGPAHLFEQITLGRGPDELMVKHKQ